MTRLEELKTTRDAAEAALDATYAAFLAAREVLDAVNAAYKAELKQENSND